MLPFFLFFSGMRLTNKEGLIILVLANTGENHAFIFSTERD